MKLARKNRGMISVYTLTLMMLVIGLLLSVTDWSVGNMKRRGRDSKALVAFQMAPRP